ncbi:MAG: nitroreductase family protein [Patescibacteria group bacterium]|jgi:nitroreductase
MINAIKKRRSIREYLSDAVSEDQIKEILMAAMYAPSANALYPWELVIVKDPGIKELLSKTTPWSTHASDASIVIAVVGHEQESSDWVEDCSIVAEHIWLEATEQGLGSCWIQIRGNNNAEKSVKEILNIPENLRVLCLMPIGVPVKAQPEHSEEKFEKTKIKYEKYK